MVPIEENIDVIEWVADPAELSTTLSLLLKLMVIFDENDGRRALVVVPDKLSLAIGRRWTKKRSFGGDRISYRYQVC